MLQDHCPSVTKLNYLAAFDRINLLNSRVWDLQAAKIAAAELWPTLVGRTVVVLGGLTAKALGLRGDNIYWQESAGVKFTLLPHPSGRCLWYNTRINRVCAGLLLEELYHSHLHPIEGEVERH